MDNTHRQLMRAAAEKMLSEQKKVAILWQMERESWKEMITGVNKDKAFDSIRARREVEEDKEYISIMPLPVLNVSKVFAKLIFSIVTYQC